MSLADFLDDDLFGGLGGDAAQGRRLHRTAADRRGDGPGGAVDRHDHVFGGTEVLLDG
jgi:hypothetical protein